MENSKNGRSAIKKVPYRERRTVKKYLVPRKLQLKRRKLKERILMLTSFVAFLALIYSISYFSNIYLQNTDLIGNPQRPQPQNPALNKEFIYRDPFLIYSIKDGRIANSAICGYDKKTRSLSVIFIDKALYLPVIGMGLIDSQSIGKEFLDEYYCSIRNFFSFELYGPFKVSEKILQPELIQQSPNSLIDDLRKNNSKANSADLWVKSVEVVPAPTLLSKVGKKTVVVVDTEKLNEAADIIFSDNFQKRKPKGTVVILNGSGVPAAGTRAAVKLIKAGYQVKTVRNAEKFDYLITEIRTKNEKTGKEISRLLMCGEVKSEKGERTVFDAVIIIGKDFANVR